MRDVLIKSLHKLDVHYAERRERERSHNITEQHGVTTGRVSDTSEGSILSKG